MDFGSIPFIVWFMPVFLIVYGCMPSKRSKKISLVVGTVCFYGVSCFAWLPHLLLLTCLAVGAAYWVQRKKKPALIVSIVFFTAILLWNKRSAHLMPGISFLIFTILSLLVDLYRKSIKQPSILEMLSYILFFPKLLSGPIARINQMNQMDEKRVTLMGERQRSRGRELEYGLAVFIIGLGYKVLIANQLAGLWHEIQTIGFVSISTPLAWLGVVGYSLQLYFDFQGYSLMAIGVAAMLGYRLPNNFDSPYMSTSVSEFYRRWHITLGSWFRDYIYIPMGGSKKGMCFTIINLFAVWFVTGLWHGMHWNFVLWAMFLFFWIACEKVFLKKYLKKIPLIGHIYVIWVIPLSWVFFALPNLADIQMCFLRLFAPIVQHEGINVATGDFAKYGSMYWPFLLAGILCAFPYVEQFLRRNYRKKIVIAVLFVIFWFSIYQLSLGVNNPFMYFSF